MKTYISHKRVKAAPITSTDIYSNGGGMVTVEGIDTPITVPVGFVREGARIKAGDYLVIYGPDGYMSWSPKDKFEAGYTLADKEEQ